MKGHPRRRAPCCAEPTMGTSVLGNSISLGWQCGASSWGSSFSTPSSKVLLEPSSQHHIPAEVKESKLHVLPQIIIVQYFDFANLNLVNN